MVLCVLLPGKQQVTMAWFCVTAVAVALFILSSHIPTSPAAAAKAAPGTCPNKLTCTWAAMCPAEAAPAYRAPCQPAVHQSNQQACVLLSVPEASHHGRAHKSVLIMLLFLPLSQIEHSACTVTVQAEQAATAYPTTAATSAAAQHNPLMLTEQTCAILSGHRWQ